MHFRHMSIDQKDFSINQFKISFLTNFRSTKCHSTEYFKYFRPNVASAKCTLDQMSFDRLLFDQTEIWSKPYYKIINYKFIWKNRHAMKCIAWTLWRLIRSVSPSWWKKGNFMLSYILNFIHVGDLKLCKYQGFHW